MGRRLFTPAHRPLTVPGTDKRVLRRPDLRSLLAPARPSGAPLGAFEQDFDDLVIYRSWRAYEPERPSEVRYFMYEFAQRDPGALEWWFGFKAVRLIRLTRVPRYLRASNAHAGPNLVFEQMRDVLAALREQQTLFVQMIAKSPQLPMVFAYGVQAVGATPEEAMAKADESYAVLAYQLEGTYQQLQYKPLTLEEGELLARYQVEWDNLAMARGRPLPTGGTLNTGALLTDARTDVESTNNQLESFVRGMGDKSFLLTMVTVPLSPAEMIGAWRNISTKLSDVRSDQEGSRSVSAGVALPLQFGEGLGNTAAATHSAGSSAGHGMSAGISHSLAHSATHTQGISTSHSNAAAVSTSHTQGVSTSHTHGVSASESHGISTSLSHGVSASQSHSQSASHTTGQSASHTTGQSASHTTGQSASQTAGQTAAHSTTTSASATQGQNYAETAGQNAAVSTSHSQSQASSLTQGITASQAHTAGTSISAGQNVAESSSVASTNSLSHTLGQSLSATHGTSSGVSVGHSSALTQGASSSQSHSVASGQSSGTSQSASLSQSHGASSSGTEGFSQSQASGQSQSINAGTTTTHGISSSAGTTQGSTLHGGVPGIGGSSASGHNSSAGNSTSSASSLGATQTGSNTNTIGTNQSLTQGLTQSMGAAASQGVTNGHSLTDTHALGASQSLSAMTGSSTSQSAGLSNSLTDGVSSAASAGQSLSQGSSLSQGASLTHAASASATSSLSHSASAGQTVGVAATAGASHGVSETQSAGVSASQTHGASASDSTGAFSTQTQGSSTSDTQGVSASQTQGVSASQTQGASVGATQGITASRALGASAGTSRGVSAGVTTGSSAAATQGQSFSSTNTTGASQAASQGTTATAAQSQGVSSQQALSDAYSVAMSRATSMTTGIGVMPNVGVMLSRVTRDEAKRILGDILEAQMRRYNEGIKSGAFLYQMFLVTPDRESLVGGEALLKSAFWGAGTQTDQLPQPFHTIDRFADDERLDAEERERLLAHARVFTSYRKREPVAELVEPFRYSSYLTPSEAAAFSHPPTAEALGIKAVWDSMPVFAMPHDRARRDIKLGHIINGERGTITDQVFGVNIEELTHTLMVGVTGAGKTTTLMRFLTDAARVTRTVTSRPTPTSPVVTQKQVRASILGLDWMPNMRNLAALVEPDRFRFYSLMKPELGRFRWNLLAIPADNITPTEWLNAQADNFTAAMSLGEFGRSLIAELLGDLYTANRLQPQELLKEVVDPATGTVLRPGVVLPPVDPRTLPPGAIRPGRNGEDEASVMTCPELSRLISMEHLAALVVAKVEEAATVQGARSSGTAMRDRIQSLWRRMSYYAPGGQFQDLLGCDPDLNTRECLTVSDLVDPDQGLVSIIETDGLDQANRRLILGSILMAVYRFGLAHGKGTFDHGGAGPGTFVVLEEAHELFREEKGEDAFTVATRNSLYESMFRRARALGLRLVAVAQNPGSLPEAVTSNTSTVFIHRINAEDDRRVVASLLNWSNTMTGNLVEMRFVGTLPVGWCLVRLEPKVSWLDAAPVLMLSDPPAVREVSDEELAQVAAARH